MENGEPGQPNDAAVVDFADRDDASEPGDRRKARHAIGDVLRDERTAQERTLADVADEAAVSLPYLSEIERGRKEVSSDLLESVCDALQVEVGDVLERAGRRLRADSLRADARLRARSSLRSSFCLAA